MGQFGLKQVCLEAREKVCSAYSSILQYWSTIHCFGSVWSLCWSNKVASKFELSKQISRSYLWTCKQARGSSCYLVWREARLCRWRWFLSFRDLSRQINGSWLKEFSRLELWWQDLRLILSLNLFLFVKLCSRAGWRARLAGQKRRSTRPRLLTSWQHLKRLLAWLLLFLVRGPFAG